MVLFGSGDEDVLMKIERQRTQSQSRQLVCESHACWAGWTPVGIDCSMPGMKAVLIELPESFNEAAGACAGSAWTFLKMVGFR